MGWRQTGDAFVLQPTYGDNPYFRAGGSSTSRGTGAWNRPSRSRLRGRSDYEFMIKTLSLLSLFATWLATSRCAKEKGGNYHHQKPPCVNQEIAYANVATGF